VDHFGVSKGGLVKIKINIERKLDRTDLPVIVEPKVKVDFVRWRTCLNFPRS
jgi:hypothetical protein